MAKRKKRAFFRGGKGRTGLHHRGLRKGKQAVQ